MAIIIYLFLSLHLHQKLHQMAEKEEEQPDQTEGTNQQAERQICSEMCLGGELFKGEQDHLSRDGGGLWR